MYWFKTEPKNIDQKYLGKSDANNAGILEHQWIFKSKKFGITRNWCRFAATSKKNHGFNLLTFIKNLVEKEPQHIVDTYTARLPKQISLFLVRVCKSDMNESDQTTKNELCPYTVVQHRETINLFFKMLNKHLTF